MLSNKKRVDYSNSHKGEGKEYDDSFTYYPPRLFQWKLEKILLKKELKNIDRNIKVMDLATGTGRIAKYLHKDLNFKNVIGIDNANSMLDIARKDETGIEYRLFDIREKLPKNSENIGVITAFRFFGKADHALMNKAALFIDHISQSNTLIILNNHNNYNSLTFRISRIIKREMLEGRKDSEILQLFSSKKYMVINHFSTGITLQSGRRYFLGKVFSEIVESLNLIVFARKHNLGVNSIYVLKKR